MCPKLTKIDLVNVWPSGDGRVKIDGIEGFLLRLRDGVQVEHFTRRRVAILVRHQVDSLNKTARS